MSPPSPSPPGDERPPTDEGDEVDSPPYRRFYRRPPPPVRVDDVNRSTEDLVGTVFQHLLQRDGHHVPDELRQRGLPHNATAQEFIRMGDRLYNQYNDDLDRLVAQLDVSCSENAYAAFAEVASTLFANGINWGRIAILFLFGYKLAVRFVVNKAPMMFMIIGWVVRYVADKLAEWIAQHGGWEAMYQEYGTHMKVFALVLIGVVALYAFTRWRRGGK